jgi:hypothetical protein
MFPNEDEVRRLERGNVIGLAVGVGEVESAHDGAGEILQIGERQCALVAVGNLDCAVVGRAVSQVAGYVFGLVYPRPSAE